MESQFNEINLEDLNFKELNLKKSVSSPPPGLVNSIIVFLYEKIKY